MMKMKKGKLGSTRFVGVIPKGFGVRNSSSTKWSPHPKKISKFKKHY